MSRSPRLDLPERIRDKATLARVVGLALTHTSPRAARLLAECAEWWMTRMQEQISKDAAWKKVNDGKCYICGKPNEDREWFLDCRACGGRGEDARTIRA
jgi:hypothetical protein